MSNNDLIHVFLQPPNSSQPKITTTHNISHVEFWKVDGISCLCGPIRILSELDRHTQSQFKSKFKDLRFKDLEPTVLFSYPQGKLDPITVSASLVIEVAYRASPSSTETKKIYFFQRLPSEDFRKQKEDIFSQYTFSIRYIAITDLQEPSDVMQVKDFYKNVEAERAKLQQSLTEKESELEAKKQELNVAKINLDELRANLYALESSSSAGKDLAEELRQAFDLADLNSRIYQSTNNVTSALLKLEEMSKFAEALKQDSTLDTLKKEAQANAEMADALAPDSAEAKQAKESAKSVDLQIIEARNQAGTTVTTAEKAKKLLEKLSDYIATKKLSLEMPKEEDLNAKGIKIDNARQLTTNIPALTEKILAAFTESLADLTASAPDSATSSADSTAIPPKARTTRASKITAHPSVTKDNIGDVTEFIREQILTARLAEQAARTAKEAAEREAAMTKKKQEEASELYKQNSQALDRLFGLTTASEKNVEQKEPDKPEVPAGVPDTSLSQTGLKKSLKQLFGLPDSERASQSNSQPSTPLPVPSADSPADSANSN